MIKIDDIDAKPVKSRIPAVFEGDFQSPKKSNFIDDIAFLESKNDFEAVRKANLAAFFSFQNLTKKRFSKLQPFFEKNLKKFLKSVKIMMKNVAKV